MSKQITVGSGVTVRSIASKGNAKATFAAKAITVAMVEAAATMPAWLESTTDRSSDAGTVLSFRSGL